MPETINGYQVFRKIAETNTAEIFHVLRLVGRGRGGEFALKVLRQAFARDSEQRGALENELRVCEGLDHPNLARIYAVETGAARPFLVMEYIPGSSLRDLLTRGEIPLTDGLEWIAQVASGLSHFHHYGYVHRDVKPQNMVVGKDGVVRVIDFALAIPQETSRVKHLLRRLSARRRPGTWSYMAPEQIRNRRLTASTDIYGLGVALFETVTGKLPYAAETPQALLEMHLSGQVPALRHARRDVPIELDELVTAMLAKDPLDRPTGMGYVSMKLREIAKAV